MAPVPVCGYIYRQILTKCKEAYKMALINCPECGKEISDAALSCPHCGYTINRSGRSLQKTELSPVPITFRIAGILAIAFGFISIPIALIMGFVLVFGSFFVIGLGIHLLGSHPGTCPYCGKKVDVFGTNCKCPHCQKVSVKSGNYLEPVD